MCTAVKMMSWPDSIAREQHTRVRVDASLVGNKGMTRPAECRVVQHAPALSCIIDSQRIELFLEFVIPKFNVEPIEEQFEKSLLSLTREQMPEGLPSGRSNSKLLNFHLVE